jgi:hypothetical protein
MALIVPVLATLTMGIVELGLLLNAYISIVNLGREGARVALDGANNCEIRSLLLAEGNRRVDFTNQGRVVIVRGATNASQGFQPLPAAAPYTALPPTNYWWPDPNNPIGPTIRPQDIVAQDLAGLAGVSFVVVEVHYVHQTLTRLPFIDQVPVSTHTMMRTTLDEVSNGHSC